MLDWSRVEQLREEVGEEAFDEVVELFLEEAEEQLAALDPAAPAARLEMQLHALKSAAVNLGFDAFAQLCAAGEAAARAGDPGGVDLEAVKASYEQTQIAFVEKLALQSGEQV